MIVNHLNNPNLVYKPRIDPAIPTPWNRIVIRYEGEPVRAPEVHRKLVAPVLVQGMAVPRHTAHVRKSGRCPKGGKAATQQPPVLCAPCALTLPVARAVLLQLAA